MVSTSNNLGSSLRVLASQLSASSCPVVLSHDMGLSRGGCLYTRGQCFPVSRVSTSPRFHVALASSSSPNSSTAISVSVSGKTRTCKVGDLMTKKKDLLVVKTTTPVDEALEILARRRISGLPVVDDDWNLVGVVSDYDLLALDFISGDCENDTMFPEVHRSWKAFYELQKLLSKTHGQVVGDLMTPTPLVVGESSELEHAARLLLETKFRRLPVVDGNGKLVGLITRGNIVKAALMIKRTSEEYSS